MTSFHAPLNRAGTTCLPLRVVFARPWELLGLGCFFAWFQLTRHVVTAPTVVSLTDMVDNRQLLEMFLAVALVAVLFARGVRPAGTSMRMARMAGVFGAACTCASLSLAGVLGSAPVLTCALLLIACVCAAWLALAWCWVFACASTSRTVVHVLVSVLFARTVGLVCMISTDIVAVFFAMAMPVASALLLTDSRLSPSGWEGMGSDGGDEQEGLCPSRLVLIVFAIVLLGFIIGVYKQAYSVHDVGNPGTGPRSVAILLTHVAVMTCLLFAVRDDLFAGAYRATMFLLAVGCACASVAAGWAEALSSTLVLWSQFMLMGLVWVIAPRVFLNMGGHLRVQLVGWGFAAFYASSALGALAYAPVSAALRSVLPSHAPIQLAALLCVLAVHFFMIREQDVRRLVDLKEAAYHQGREALLVGCRAVAAAYALSEREFELLPRWVLGETAAQIAEDLSISENTVRTHVRHVYVKTGAHDRTELMGLIRAS